LNKFDLNLKIKSLGIGDWGLGIGDWDLVPFFKDKIFYFYK
jgi:hypothetical protein